METPPAARGPTPQNAFVRGAKKTFLYLTLFVLIIAAGTVAFLMFASYGEGYRVGNIQKLSKKGHLFKTWEGELTQGFIETSADTTGGAAGVSTRIWYFTVENDDAVVKAIDHAIETNKRVKLFYKEKYTHLPWVGDTRQIVYKVEEVQ